MMQSSGFEQGSNLVYKLRKVLHQLRQAPRAWFAKLNYYLIQFGFVSIKSDTSPFVYNSSQAYIVVLVYVYDIIITGNPFLAIDFLISRLNAIFSLKYLHLLSYFLGLKVTMANVVLYLNQQKYIKKLLDKCGLMETKDVDTSMTSGKGLNEADGTLLNDAAQYKSLEDGS